MTMTKKINEYIEKNKQEIISLWKEVVNVNSGTLNIEGVNEVCNIFARELKKSNFKVEIYEFDGVGNSMIATYNKGLNTDPILFLGHMDTVFNDEEDFDRKFKIVQDKAYGPGVLDMKAGIVIGIFVARILQEMNYNIRPIKFILTGDEENAHANSNVGEFIENQSKGSYAAINFETGRLDNGIVVARKGSLSYKVKVNGVSAHSGNDPEIGRSAILETAHKVIELESLNDIERGKLVNCGIISGGTTDNTIPGECSIDILTRSTTLEIQEEIRRDVEEILNKVYVEGTSTEYKSIDGMPPMEKTDKNMDLFELAKSVANNIGISEPYPVEVGGGADSSFTSKVGVPTICALGAKGEYNHTDREYALVESVYERINYISNIVLELN